MTYDDITQNNLNDFFERIECEREYQVQKWTYEFDTKNTPNDWVAFISKYLGQSVTLPWNPEQFKTQLVKVATLCAAAHEWCERTNGQMPKRHYD